MLAGSGTLYAESDRDFTIDEMAFDVELESALLDLRHKLFCGDISMLKSGLEDDDAVYTEGAKDIFTGAIDAIKRAFDTIIKFISNVAKKAKEKFEAAFAKNKANHLSPEDFKNSQTFAILVNDHYDKRLKEIEDQMSLGDKLIRKASNGTGISEVELKGYINGSKKVIENGKKLTFKVVKGVGIGAGIIIGAKAFKAVAMAALTGMAKLEDIVDNEKKAAEKGLADAQKKYEAAKAAREKRKSVAKDGDNKSVNKQDSAAEPSKAMSIVKEIINIQGNLAKIHTGICNNIIGKIASTVDNGIGKDSPEANHPAYDYYATSPIKK